MTIDFDKIVQNLKALKHTETHLDFIKVFLKSFNFPNSTIKKVELNYEPNVRLTKLRNKIMFISTDKPALHLEMDSLKQKGLNHISERYIILFNKTDIYSTDTIKRDSFKCSRYNLSQNIDFFSSLLGFENINEGKYASINTKTAEKFATIYNALITRPDLKNHCSIDDVGLSIVRLVAIFWMESLGIIQNGLLKNIFNYYSSDNGDNTNNVLFDIFSALGKDNKNYLPSHFQELPFLNIDLFSKEIKLPSFSRSKRRLLIELSDIDWRHINPDILGSLMQSILDPFDSYGLSNHYTSSANIEKVIGPLFLNKFYLKLQESINDDEILELLKILKKLKVFDPSSGAGNFLIVSFKELKKIEKMILDKISDKSKVSHFKSLHPSQFYGIEINPFKASITKLGLCISYFQEEENIHYGFDKFCNVYNSLNVINSNPTKIDWGSFCKSSNKCPVYIVTNPTYRGARKQTKKQKDDVERVFTNYKGIKNLDYSSCWIYLASVYIENENSSASIVATNSIVQGEQVGLLWPKVFSHNVEIDFAHTSFKWRNGTGENTGVTVVIIGLGKKDVIKKKILMNDNQIISTGKISPYLTPGTEIIVEKSTKPISNLPYMPKGNMPYDGGHLLLTTTEKDALIKEYPDSKKYIKRIMGSKEFIQGLERWCLWIEDNCLGDAISIKPIKQRIDKVRELRINSSDAAARKLAERPHQFRETNSTTEFSIIIPSVSSENRVYIPIGFIDSSTIISNLAFALYNCEVWVFGLLTSHMHNLWIRTVCGALETRIRYSSRLGYNTFPFPDINKEKKNSIMDCVYQIIAERENYPEIPLSELYNPNSIPSELIKYHKNLDRVIESCYQEKQFNDDNERLDFMLQKYRKIYYG